MAAVRGAGTDPLIGSISKLLADAELPKNRVENVFT
jgi:hypothetical protein